MLHFRFLSALLLLGPVFAAGTKHGTKTVVPAQPYSGESYAQFISTASGLDAPKVSPVNSTVIDWWYFDTVSVDSNASMVVVFFTTGTLGFPNGTVTAATITGSFANGTLYSATLLSTEADIISEGQGSSAVFKGAGASWEGSPDLSRYVLDINSPSAGIKGKLVFNSRAPAHYTCGSVGPGREMRIFPHIGWANAIPDSEAIADFTIGDTKLHFVGSGYHDKNWSDQPLQQNVESWYWGHARVGPYSVVWFDGIATNGKEYTSAYAARNGRIITASCESGIQVRPSGGDSTYPPRASAGLPEGFQMKIDLAEEGALEVKVSNSLVILDERATSGYTRWIGTAAGSLNGHTLKGISLQEQIVLVP